MHLPDVGLLEFEAVRRGAEGGYRATVDAVTEWAADRPWERRPSPT
ncbi:MAG: hypothetical protein AAFZ07_28860 [Actinomycetota bacterium]